MTLPRDVLIALYRREIRAAVRPARRILRARLALLLAAPADAGD